MRDVSRPFFLSYQIPSVGRSRKVSLKKGEVLRSGVTENLFVLYSDLVHEVASLSLIFPFSFCFSFFFFLLIFPFP